MIGLSAKSDQSSWDLRLIGPGQGPKPQDFRSSTQQLQGGDVLIPAELRGLPLTSGIITGVVESKIDGGFRHISNVVGHS